MRPEKGDLGSEPCSRPPPPMGVFSSVAMRFATLLAAILRGWVCPISLPPLMRQRPSASAILGSCVVLPEPVSPQTTTT